MTSTVTPEILKELDQAGCASLVLRSTGLTVEVVPALTTLWGIPNITPDGDGFIVFTGNASMNMPTLPEHWVMGDEYGEIPTDACYEYLAAELNRRDLDSERAATIAKVRR